MAIKSILSTVILMGAVAGGGFAGNFVKSQNSNAPSEKHASDDGHDKKEKSHKKEKSDDGRGKKDKKSKKGKDDGHGDSSASKEVSYLKFKRQFVVPQMIDGRIAGLVIMNFNLELNDDAPGNIYSYEPKLRDAIMRDLLTLSNDGNFGDQLMSPNTYDQVRETLLESVQHVVSEGISDVLILDISRRDQ